MQCLPAILLCIDILSLISYVNTICIKVQRIHTRVYLNGESRSNNKLQKKLSSALPIDSYTRIMWCSYIYPFMFYPWNESVYSKLCTSTVISILHKYIRTLSIFGRSCKRNISLYILLRKIPHHWGTQNEWYSVINLWAARYACL